MALFDRTINANSNVDDTEKLISVIENAQNVNKHTEYILRVQKGPSQENKWVVSHRYKDFAALHAVLLQSNIDLPIPPKKLIGNMHPSFVAERQIALQKYINEVLKYQILALSLPVRRFLDPSNYADSIAEQALQTVSIALRGDGRYELKGPIADIGWRIRKHYFMVNDTDSKMDCLLSWQSYGPDRYLSDKDLQAAFKSLLNLSHPYIDPIFAINNLETGVYVVRRIHENGSLRDILYGTEYSKNYLSKYGNPKLRKPLTIGQISHYGYQILQALKFLHEKGLPHGHLHAGNVAIENQRVLLLDLENILVGSPCLHRQHSVRRRRAAGAETQDVYAFGRLLYEMAFAVPLEDYYCDYYPEGINQDLESVLDMCLSRGGERRGAGSLAQLLRHPLFARAAPHSPPAPAPAPTPRAHLKFPLALKDELRRAVEATEARLKRDQKLLRHAIREVRIQEIINSEEEMKKQKRKMRKRESVWPSTSSLAETAASRSASSGSSPTPPAPLSAASVESPEPAVGGARSPAGGAEPRASLLSAICSFDKTRLARVAR